MNDKNTLVLLYCMLFMQFVIIIVMTAMLQSDRQKSDSNYIDGYESKTRYCLLEKANHRFHTYCVGSGE